MHETNNIDSANELTKKAFYFELILFSVLSISIPVLTKFFLYPSLDWSQNTPIPFRTFILGLLILYFVRKQHLRLSDFGFKKPDRYSMFFFVLLLLTGLQVVVPSSTATFFDFPSSDYSFFNHVQGNLSALLFWIVLSWVFGAFFEELIFRSYLLDRLKQIFGGKRIGIVIAVLVQALIFGFFHLYQGWGGIILTAIGGVISGTVYVLYKNIWPNVISHGLLNSLGFISFYLNGVQ